MQEVTPLRIVYLGSKWLGVQCLELLLRQPRVQIIGVVPNDAPGWWSKPGVREVSDVAKEHGLPIISQTQILELNGCDLGLTILHHSILPSEIIRHFPNGIFNLHPGPLPRYRGYGGYAFAIINGDENYGVTLHLIDEKVDTGPIVDRLDFKIPKGCTARELHDLAQEKCLELFERALPKLIAGEIAVKAQSEINEKSEVHKKRELFQLRKIDLRIDEKTMRQIRALTFPPFEKPYIEYDGRKIYLSLSDDHLEDY